jgi:hypothetical protein
MSYFVYLVYKMLNLFSCNLDGIEEGCFGVDCGFSSNVVENRKIKPYFFLWLDSITYSLSFYRSRKNSNLRAGHYIMFIASRYGSIRHQEVWFVSEILCYFTHLHCGITKFLAIEKLFMNKPGDSIDEFRWSQLLGGT